MINRTLDLADIQGNIVRPYGRFGFPLTRHLFFSIGNAAAGRRFVAQVRSRVTSAERWRSVDAGADSQAPEKPKVAVNIGFSFRGLLALKLPTRTLSNLPEEFIDGMAKRWSILGDIDVSAPQNWDEIWRKAWEGENQEIHIWVSLSSQFGSDGKPVAELAQMTAWLKEAADASEGVSLLSGHKGADPAWQDSCALPGTLKDGTPCLTPKEHFCFTDGISDPAFSGQYEPAVEAEEVIGGGKLLPKGKGWAALATGEFILGHASEAQELPPSAPPWSFMRNGTFMAYRKLHQNVGSFDAYIENQAALFQRVGGVANLDDARETLMAKMVGRWRSGIPLSIAPTWEAAKKLEDQWDDIPGIQAKVSPQTPENLARLAAYEKLVTNFRYQDDPKGTKCPVGAHTRRSNPRDGLGPDLKAPGLDTALANRRRILRRGLPYGSSLVRDDEGEHGVIFMALCSSLFRQFEFVQQQWIQYGAVFNCGNDTDALVGLHRKDAKFVIPADPGGGGIPFICGQIPQFVATRGGEYFFLPSLTALRQIAQGSVDPT